MADTYRIVRIYQFKPGRRRLLDSGLTLEQAQAHCRNPETSSRTCTGSRKKIQVQHGPWFDAYENERK